MVGWLVVVVVAGNGTGVSFSTCQPPPASATCCCSSPTLPNLPSHFLPLDLHLFCHPCSYGGLGGILFSFLVPFGPKTPNFLPIAAFFPPPPCPVLYPPFPFLKPIRFLTTSRNSSTTFKLPNVLDFFRVLDFFLETRCWSPPTLLLSPSLHPRLLFPS